MIYVVFAPPRAGKTFFATKWALEQMKKKEKKVFSNYPIFDKKLGSSYIWKPEYCGETITDSFIVIDEAYRDFNSRNFKSFSQDEHLFFATNGHNNNDILLIAHSPQRIDVVIREMVNVFYYVKKFQIPFIMSRPIWFKVEGFIDELSLSQRYTNKNAVFSIERYFYRRKIARAYDTHYFRKPEDTQINFEKWVVPGV